MNNDPSTTFPVETAAAPTGERVETTAGLHQALTHRVASATAASPTTRSSALILPNLRARVPETPELETLNNTGRLYENNNRQSRLHNRSVDVSHGSPPSPRQTSSHGAEAWNTYAYPDLNSTSRTQIILPDDPDARARVLDNGMREIQEAMNTAQLARATSTQFTPALPDETLEQYLDRRRRENASGSPDRAEEFRQRSRELTQYRDEHPELGNNMNLNLAIRVGEITAEMNSTTTSLLEQSASTRRDLERALREYRVARRALRSRNAEVLNAAREQSNDPSYSGVVARIAEHSSNIRDRLRARGHSRSNTLDRSDALVDRIASASGISTEAWRSDDDQETAAGSSDISASRPMRDGEAPPSQGPRSSLPSGVFATSRPLHTTDGAANTSSLVQNRTRSDSIRPLADSASNGSSTIASTSRSGSSRLELTAEGSQRFHDTLQRFNNTLSRLGPNPSGIRQNSTAKPVRPSHNTAKKRARSSMKYLSELKNINDDGNKALVLASSLGIDSLASSLAKETEVDLPLRISELPQPSYSSWLECGMSWEGVQKGGFVRPDAGPGQAHATGPLFQANGNARDRVLLLRRQREAERLRAMHIEQDRLHNPAQSITEFEQEARALLAGYAGNRDENLADMEARLTNLLEGGQAQGVDDDWETHHRPNRPRRMGAPVPAPAPGEKLENGDQWPVSVKLHEVDWEEMRLTGTMIANQIPDRARPPPNEGEAEKEQDTGNVGMETFFDGEIIDFHTNELETSADKAGYKVGGLITDIKYWSRIGPFKAEVDKNLEMARTNKAFELYEKLGLKGTIDQKKEEYVRTFQSERGNADELDKEEIGTVVYDTMADCLSSRKWWEKAMGDGGWVLMRWKERCFITPESSRPSSSSSSTTVPDHHNRYRTIVHRPTPTTQAYTTMYASEQHNDRASWGLTIRGFYYVAMHRLTGKIEALYFDSGSQPYQQLTCKPIGTGSTRTTKQVQDIDMEGIGNVKRYFGSFEFR